MISQSKSGFFNHQIWFWDFLTAIGWPATLGTWRNSGSWVNRGSRALRLGLSWDFLGDQKTWWDERGTRNHGYSASWFKTPRSILHGYKLIRYSLLVLMGISTFTSIQNLSFFAGALWLIGNDSALVMLRLHLQNLTWGDPFVPLSAFPF